MSSQPTQAGLPLVTQRNHYLFSDYTLNRRVPDLHELGHLFTGQHLTFLLAFAVCGRCGMIFHHTIQGGGSWL